MNNFLRETELVNFSDPAIIGLANTLRQNTTSDLDIARNCFLYVRDKVNHSGDVVDETPTTYRASDVLKHKTGWCYAKSILLAALLRANSIPTGFCYQRLSCSEYVKDVYCLHGLNAVFLKEFGWYRIDARGNKEDVNAQFDPPHEQLAFEVGKYEFDLLDILEDPLPEVVHALKTYKSYEEMIHNFPDITEETIEGKVNIDYINTLIWSVFSKR